ncbi:Unknown protein sequence [Pseudomonas syringae pv. maculicola]|nr:Unknown protein sequence [Pseudomonas syringae pv. maculicola]
MPLGWRQKAMARQWSVGGQQVAQTAMVAPFKNEGRAWVIYFSSH